MIDFKHNRVVIECPTCKKHFFRTKIIAWNQTRRYCSVRCFLTMLHTSKARHYRIMRRKWFPFTKRDVVMISKLYDRNFDNLWKYRGTSRQDVYVKRERELENWSHIVKEVVCVG